MGMILLHNQLTGCSYHKKTLWPSADVKLMKTEGQGTLTEGLDSIPLAFTLGSLFCKIVNNACIVKSS
jgi:hypothetical protein